MSNTCVTVGGQHVLPSVTNTPQYLSSKPFVWKRLLSRLSILKSRLSCQHHCATHGPFLASTHGPLAPSDTNLGKRGHQLRHTKSQFHLYAVKSTQPATLHQQKCYALVLLFQIKAALSTQGKRGAAIEECFISTPRDADVYQSIHHTTTCIKVHVVLKQTMQSPAVLFWDQTRYRPHLHLALKWDLHVDIWWRNLHLHFELKRVVTLLKPIHPHCFMDNLHLLFKELIRCMCGLSLSMQHKTFDIWLKCQSTSLS